MKDDDSADKNIARSLNLNVDHGKSGDLENTEVESNDKSEKLTDKDVISLPIESSKPSDLEMCKKFYTDSGSAVT